MHHWLIKWHSSSDGRIQCNTQLWPEFSHFYFFLWMSLQLYQVTGGAETSYCCWMCVECEENEYLINETLCQTCPKGSWPNRDKTGTIWFSRITEAFPTLLIFNHTRQLSLSLSLQNVWRIRLKFSHGPTPSRSSQRERQCLAWHFHRLCSSYFFASTTHQWWRHRLASSATSCWWEWFYHTFLSSLYLHIQRRICVYYHASCRAFHLRWFMEACWLKRIELRVCWPSARSDFHRRS